MPFKRKYEIKNKRLFICWWGMKGRCDNAKRKDAKYYHDKGITYCSEWANYENFQEWALNNGYADNLTLDRKDNTKSYCPQNCRWITIQEQQKNRTFCHYFTYNGETKTLNEWARIYGINRSTLHDRIFKLGYSFEESLTPKRLTGKNTILITYNGKVYTQSQFAREYKTSHQRINNLRNKGLTDEEIAKEIIKGR